VADFAQNAEIAELLQRRRRVRGAGRVRLAPVLLGLFDLDQGREQLTQVVGQFRIAVQVLDGPAPVPRLGGCICVQWEGDGEGTLDSQDGPSTATLRPRATRGAGFSSARPHVP
jgi:hypothetical protein